MKYNVYDNAMSEYFTVQIYIIDWIRICFKFSYPSTVNRQICVILLVDVSFPEHLVYNVLYKIFANMSFVNIGKLFYCLEY